MPQFPPRNVQSFSSPQPVQANYGAANRYDFNNDTKWTTVSGVPVLDEHVLTNESGNDVGEVNAKILQEIAANNNRRVYETGDPAPLTVGHTSDDPQAPEKPVVGYAVNYRVQPFREGRNAIFVDYKVRKKHEHVIEDFPRRSVELWLGKRELDPIALLGGTTPERDLGVIIRNARFLRHELFGVSAPTNRQTVDDGVVMRYSRRSQGTVYRYSLGGEPVRFNCGPKPMNRGNEMGMNNGFGGGSMNYADDEAPDTDDIPPEDDGGGGDFGGGEEDSGEDPMVAKVFASKQMQDLTSKVDQIFDAIMGAEGGAGGAGPMGGPPGGDMGGAPPVDDGMGAPGGGMAGGGMGGGGTPFPEEEAAEFHGEKPVKFEDDPAMYAATAFAGPNNAFPPTFVPHKSTPTGQKVTKMNRTPTRPRATRPQQQPQGESEVIRLRRQLASQEKIITTLVRKNARAEAEKIVLHLSRNEGILFGRNEEEDAKGQKAEIDFLSTLDDQARDWKINEIRQKYARRANDPSRRAVPGGLAQYARQDDTQTGGEPELSMEESAQLVKFMERNRMGVDKIDEAIKMMRGGGTSQNGRPVGRR